MIRSAIPDDLAFVSSTWLRSFSTSDFAKLATPSDMWALGRASAEYYEGQRALIEHLIAHANIIVVEDDRTHMLDGFLCYAGHVAHYVYVRQSARGKGVARDLFRCAGLLDGAPVVYTHRSRGVHKLPAGWRFSIFTLMVPGFTGRKAA